MLKTGRFRAYRNLPVGWVMQAVHSTDRSERLFRISAEVLLLVLLASLLGAVVEDVSAWQVWVIAFVVTHSIMWLLSGNFWVYMLDSFLWVRNPGMPGIVRFVQLVHKSFSRLDCADAILIYGSMCRQQLHIRSDLDLRVIRRRDSWKGLLALPVGFLVRAYSFFAYIPVDLQVVDSVEFLRKQMRNDEKPIVVYLREGVLLPEAGIRFTDVENDNSIVLKDKFQRS